MSGHIVPLLSTTQWFLITWGWNPSPLKSLQSPVRWVLCPTLQCHHVPILCTSFKGADTHTHTLHTNHTQFLTSSSSSGPWQMLSPPPEMLPFWSQRRHCPSGRPSQSKARSASYGLRSPHASPTKCLWPLRCNHPFTLCFTPDGRFWVQNCISSAPTLSSRPGTEQPFRIFAEWRRGWGLGIFYLLFLRWMLGPPGAVVSQNFWKSRNLSGSDRWCGWHSVLPADARVLRTNVCGDSDYAPVFYTSRVNDGHSAHWDLVNLVRINYRQEISLQSSECWSSLECDANVAFSLVFACPSFSLFPILYPSPTLSVVLWVWASGWPYSFLGFPMTHSPFLLNKRPAIHQSPNIIKLHLCHILCGPKKHSRK